MNVMHCVAFGLWRCFLVYWFRDLAGYGTCCKISSSSSRRCLLSLSLSLSPSSLFRVYCALLQNKTKRSIARSLADAHIQMLFVVLQLPGAHLIIRPFRMLHHASVLCLSSCPSHTASSDASVVASHHVHVVHEISLCFSCTLPCPHPMFL
jgi:hypothetical protein